MKVMHSEWRDRVLHWIRTLQDDLYEPLGEISFEAALTMDRLSLSQAASLSYTPVEPGFVWGKTREYGWFHARFTLPEEARGGRIVMNLSPGGESTLYINGKSFGTYRADWVRYPHHFFEDNVLTANAWGGEEYELWMETYAGQYFPQAPTGGCATGPVLPGVYQDPLPEGTRRTLGLCTFGLWNEEAYQLLMDADTLLKLFDTIPPSSLRASCIAQALEDFTLAVDFEQEKKDRLSSYKAGREALSRALAAVNGSTAPTFYLVGNAHLDLAWLWPMAETERKTARTFAAQIRLLEQYPTYRFLQSQPAAYEMCRAFDPDLFERIQEKIREGRWIAEGAMWVEPDTNMPSGEALVRQLLYGKEYYQKVLGVDSVILWLPDTFGYSAALPQILLKAGVKYLVTQKIFWSYNEGEAFPYHYFTWEGMDGSKVTAFLPTSYTYETDPASLNAAWENRSQIRNLDSFLIPFGYGDGGGGPARDHIEYALREGDLEGMPRVRMSDPLTFFTDMEAKGGPSNTWTGELYFNAHRGTYTTQAAVKRLNRRAEVALHNLEFWGTIASLGGEDYDHAAAQRLWKELLLHQFHDILPGSGIKPVYEESTRRVSALINEADALLDRYLGRIIKKEAEKKKDKERETGTGKEEMKNSPTALSPTEAVTLANALPFETVQIVDLPERFAQGASYEDGTPVWVQQAHGRVRAKVRVPSLGMTSLYPQRIWNPEGYQEEPPALAFQKGEGFCLENGKLLVSIDGKGEIQSLIRKADQMEFAAGPMNQLRLYKDVPRLYDAWDIDSNYPLQEVPALREVEIQILRQGLEAVLEIKGKISHSTLTQHLILAAGEERIRFETEIEWQELHRLLKVSFPTTIHTTEGINEIQFGYVKRPTTSSRDYDKDRFEVCNHRYSALYDGRNGFALLNDCKYGISMPHGTLALTLLRAAAAPEMRSDNGHHRFTYALALWEGSFADSLVFQYGYELNNPLLVREGAVTPSSFASLDQKNVFIDTVKTAEDQSGDILLRLYEAAGCATQANLRIRLTGEAFETDLLEKGTNRLEQKAGVYPLSFHPFEIKTIRFSRHDQHTCL